MADDRWNSVAVPILEAVARRETEDFMTIGDLADEIQVDPDRTVIEVERLVTEGFLAAPLQPLMSGGDVRPWFFSPRLGERGARVVGTWPSDDPFQAMIGVLDRRIAESGNEAERTRFQRLRAAFTDVGTASAAGILVELAKALVGVR